MKKQYLKEEQKKLLHEIDSIRRWDKVSLTKFQSVCWFVIRWIIIKLTNVKY